MQFNSYTFLLFFSVVLGLHYLPLPWRLKKLNLILASTVFYAAWNPPFVILIWISTLVDWQAARGIRRAQSPVGKRLFVLLSLATNLGLLAYFKYGTFAVQTFLDLLGAMGSEIQLAPPASFFRSVSPSTHSRRCRTQSMCTEGHSIRPIPSSTTRST